MKWLLFVKSQFGEHILSFEGLAVLDVIDQLSHLLNFFGKHFFALGRLRAAIEVVEVFEDQTYSLADFCS